MQFPKYAFISESIKLINNPEQKLKHHADPDRDYFCIPKNEDDQKSRKLFEWIEKFDNHMDEEINTCKKTQNHSNINHVSS